MSNKKRSWIPNMKKIEIEITTFCNLCCFNCNRSVRQAASNEQMTLNQIIKFVNESIELNWNWKYIGLLGGEPTLHPHIFDILRILKRYRDIKQNCIIELVTNGYGRKVNKILSKLPSWVNIRNSYKTSIKNKFFSYNISPIDIKEYKNADFTRGCKTTQECGLGLTRYGYYPCGAGASLDRVFGFDIAIKRLSLVNQQTLKSQLRLLCRFCGHFKRNFNNDKRITKEMMSKTWIKAYKEYQKAKPNLSLY